MQMLCLLATALPANAVLDTADVQCVYLDSLISTRFGRHPMRVVQHVLQIEPVCAVDYVAPGESGMETD